MLATADAPGGAALVTVLAGVSIPVHVEARGVEVPDGFIGTFPVVGGEEGVEHLQGLSNPHPADEFGDVGVDVSQARSTS